MAYNASTNNTFFRRLERWALNLEDLLQEAQSVDDMWVGQDVTNSSDFVAQDHMSTGDATNTITLMRALDDFMRNVSVSQGDRIPTLTAMLGRDLR